MSVCAAVSGAAWAHGFGGENILSTKWRDWHHNTLSRFACQEAGFFRKVQFETESEDPDSPASEVSWHSSFIDSYAYNPLYWVMGGPSRIACAAGVHDELIKLHFDDLTSLPQVRHQYFQITTGTVAGLIYAKQVFESGRQVEGLAMGRQVLGVTLHALQDFYSHSNWIDHPSRRETTWFSKFTTSLPELVQTTIFTGTYETPAHLGAKPHGVMSPMISALMQISPVMDALSSDISPVREMPIMDFWRRNRNNIQSIQPGVFPDSNVSTQSDGLLAPTSQTFIGLPAGTLYVAPPGIALDASYLRNIAVQQRGLTDINGDTAFKLAYRRAYDASVQFLKRLEVTMNGIPGGPAYWVALKTHPTTNRHTQTYENFAQQAYQFVSAGENPPNATLVQSHLPAANSIPPKQYFLRVKLKTSTDAFSGTDADIKLIAGGREFLLDVTPTHGQDNLHAILSFNDFENGMETTYLVGPFWTLPTQIELKNQSADAGVVLKAFFDDFGAAVVGFLQSIGNFFANLFGAAADWVGQSQRVFQAADLRTVTSSWRFHNLIVDGGAEGKYTINAQIRKVGTNDTEDFYHVRIPTMTCNKESTIDQLKFGLGGDEPFVLAALQPLPGDVMKSRSWVFKWAHDGDFGKLQAPLGNETNELRANRSGAFFFDWPLVRVPKNHGMLALAVCVMESDDETESDRQRMMDEFAGQLDTKTKPVREGFRSALGRAIAADWKLDSIEVYGFAKGGAVEAGPMLTQSPRMWIQGGRTVPFALNPSTVVKYPVDVLSLQKLVMNKTKPGSIKPGLVNVEIKNMPGKASVLKPPATGPATLQPPPGGLSGATIKNPKASAGGKPPEQAPPTRSTPPSKLTPAPGGPVPVPFPNVTARPPRPIAGQKALLVDDDRSPNNAATPPGGGLSASDAFYQDLLAKAGLAAEPFVVASAGTGPDAAKLAAHNLVVWYTADQQGSGRDTGDLAAVDKANLTTWLNAGTGRTLILISPGLAGSISGLTIRLTTIGGPATPDPFLTQILGASGAVGGVARQTAGAVKDTTGTPFNLSKDAPIGLLVGGLVPSTASPLFTWTASGVGAKPTVVATAHRVGQNRVVYVGFPLENAGAGAAEIFRRFLAIHNAP